MTDIGEWLPLNIAADRLRSALGDELETRLLLITEMQAKRLVASAVRWIEELPPSTFRARPLAIDLGGGRTQIPEDFWHREHAWDATPGGDIAPRTSADWHLLRFQTAYKVNGGNPNWSDRWGERRNDMGDNWTWRREAIGIEIDLLAFERLIAAFTVGRAPGGEDAPRSRGFAVADGPRVKRAIQMVLTGEAKSANDAARIIATEMSIHGKGNSFEADRDRLGRAIRKEMNKRGLGK